MARSVAGSRTFDLNLDGVAHVGMLPDLIADFEAMGLSRADLEPLLSSADGFVSLWERASGQPAAALPPWRAVVPPVAR